MTILPVEGREKDLVGSSSLTWTVGRADPTSVQRGQRGEM